jgi:hypothetical protein
LLAIAQEFKSAVAQYNGSSHHRGRYPSALKSIAQRYMTAALQAGDSTEAISGALGISSKTVKMWASERKGASQVVASPRMAPVEVVSEPVQTTPPRYSVHAPAGLLIECDLVGVVQLIRALA